MSEEAIIQMLSDLRSDNKDLVTYIHAHMDKEDQRHEKMEEVVQSINERLIRLEERTAAGQRRLTSYAAIAATVASTIFTTFINQLIEKK